MYTSTIFWIEEDFDWEVVFKIQILLKSNCFMQAVPAYIVDNYICTCITIFNPDYKFHV